MNDGLGPYLQARWRGYAERIGAAIVLAGLLMSLAAVTARWWLLPLGALVALLAAWFYAASSWQLRMQLDSRRSAETAWETLKLDRFARFLSVEVGLRSTSLRLSRRLQRGTLKIIDVYNPQLMPSSALGRLRTVAQLRVTHEPSDPRALWVEGRIGQLPQRDASVPAVVIDQVLSALTQSGDRDRLLREVFRVLEPGGKLVVIEPTMRPSNRWAMGSWVSAETFTTHIDRRHFTAITAEPVNGLLTAFTATKPVPQASQLHFNF